MTGRRAEGGLRKSGGGACLLALSVPLLFCDFRPLFVSSVLISAKYRYRQCLRKRAKVMNTKGTKRSRKSQKGGLQSTSSRCPHCASGGEEALTSAFAPASSSGSSSKDIRFNRDAISSQNRVFGMTVQGVVFVLRKMLIG